MCCGKLSQIAKIMFFCKIRLAVKNYRKINMHENKPNKKSFETIKKSKIC